MHIVSDQSALGSSGRIPVFSFVSVASHAGMAGRDTEIVVTGAGMAGLTAARVLAEAGRQVLILEARDRVGGRILTVNPGREAVELGAEFVHGKPPELWELLEEANLQTQERDGSELCWLNGKFSACGPLLEHEFRWIEALRQWREEDCSFADYLHRSQMPETTRMRLTDYVEGFNAADQCVIGVASLGRQQTAEDQIEGDRIFHVAGGYHQVPEFLARTVVRAGAQILLNSRVTAVDWKPGSVQVDIDCGGAHSQIHASRVVITLPLGVLLTGSIRFTPYPETVLQAASRLRMGTVQRVVFQFREPFWMDGSGDLADDLRRLSFLYSTGNAPSVWWTSYPENQCRLTAWTGGPRTTLLPETHFKLEQYLLRDLARVFERSDSSIRELFVRSFAHDWQRDPFASGAYSYPSVGAADVFTTISAPVKETLYFAGEHTDSTGHWGTVHGAVRSGHRAAAQILG